MRITYLELLNRIKSGNAPKAVRYYGRTFEFDEHNYVSKDEIVLSELIGRQWTSRAQTNARCIGVIE